MRKTFKEQDKIDRLLWCDRHCCLCEKHCDIHIEFAHIDSEGGNDIDNAIPICYDCHAKIGMYNKQHPRGNKFRIKELKTRREYIYDKYTRHLIVPVPYIITNSVNPYEHNKDKRKYPDITFNIQNTSNFLSIKLFVTLTGTWNGKNIDLKLIDGLYNGHKVWHLNPCQMVNGHFQINNKLLTNLKERHGLKIKATIKQIDIYNREHKFLENGYI